MRYEASGAHSSKSQVTPDQNPDSSTSCSLALSAVDDRPELRAAECDAAIAVSIHQVAWTEAKDEREGGKDVWMLTWKSESG